MKRRFPVGNLCNEFFPILYTDSLKCESFAFADDFNYNLFRVKLRCRKKICIFSNFHIHYTDCIQELLLRANYENEIENSHDPRVYAYVYFFPFASEKI